MLLIKDLGLVDYAQTYQQMQDFTHKRTAETPDEIWLLEHPAIYTLGKRESTPTQPKEIHSTPTYQTDRGGLTTYHAPGQLIAYLMLDLKRRKLGVRQLVTLIEESIIALLAKLNISAEARADAPGIYVAGDKIASLGLKVSKQKTYHGLALNVAMDLKPFQLITPCGLEGIKMTQIKDLLQDPTTPTYKVEDIKPLLIAELKARLKAL